MLNRLAIVTPAVLRRSQGLCPSLRGLDRIETVIQDETGKKGGIEIPPDARPGELVIPLRQQLFVYVPCRWQNSERHVFLVPNSISSPPAALILLRKTLTNAAGGRTFVLLPVPLPLPGLVGQFFGLNRGAVTKDAVGKLAVTALAFGRNASLSPFASERWIAFGPHAHLCALFPTPLLVKSSGRLAGRERRDPADR